MSISIQKSTIAIDVYAIGSPRSKRREKWIKELKKRLTEDAKLHADIRNLPEHVWVTIEPTRKEMENLERHMAARLKWPKKEQRKGMKS